MVGTNGTGAQGNQECKVKYALDVMDLFSMNGSFSTEISIARN